ncbi:MAG: NAD(P)-dependent alcohol dehydrogenase [Leptospiraceae bacterium]|nr:NAD(P)-dependent alcohol dehydrogenase [Leptospiraceae bacterium]MDW7976747.1 NAD(P)-dependent alcohol dehydrogenase [Leptospiraceae bacterium]
MKVSAYASFQEKSELEPYEFELKPLQDHEVLVKITHCGICHSDVHLIDNDWKISSYPLVPGHEIIGIVEKTGKNVKNLKIGMRVGIGWQAGSCGHCEYCLMGQEQFCEKHIATCVGRPGGFATYTVVESKFAIPIPEDLPSDTTAPLLCGGITVYNPLRNFAHPSIKIGVIGMGGLGHLAIEFASAFGCEIIVFSTTKEKEREAKELGAHHFVYLPELTKKEIRLLKRSFDMILSTVFVDLDWNMFLSFLKPNGRLHFVGAGGTLNIPIPNILENLHISGSIIGSPSLIKEMLEFARRHKIKAKIETFPLEEVNQAIRKLRNNTIRYRAVLFHK